MNQAPGLASAANRRRRPIIAGIALVACGLLASLDLAAQQAETVVVRNAPAKVAVTDALVGRLGLPAGFRVSIFARELVDPRMLQVAGDGTVYVSRWRSGDVLALRDRDGDGAADSRESIGRLAGAHGLELREPFLAVASATGVWVAAVSRGRVLGRPLELIDDLPDGGYRIVRVRFSNGQAVGIEDFMTGFLSDDGGSYFGRPTGLAEGPDGSLYISDDANGVIYRVRYTG